jgi:hypothetical protein
MPIVSAWKCPRTSKLFEEKSKYVGHLKVLAKKSLADQRNQKRLAAKELFFKNMRDTCRDASDIEKFVIDNWEAFVHNGADGDPWRGKKAYKIPKILWFNLSLGKYQFCSNTHSCPIGGVQNFCQTNDKPKGYWGWQGTFSWIIDCDTPCFPSHVFDNTGINPGGGSGADLKGKRTYGGDLKLFADDWPLMKYDAESRAVLGRLLDRDQTVDDFM